MNKEALNQVYNVAHGERTTLNQLFMMIRNLAGEYDKKILKIEPVYGPVREGDIPHSLLQLKKQTGCLVILPDIMLRKDLKRL